MNTDGEEKKGKRNLQYKIRSQKGATLMVALLTFLMCACVGSVVLAAAATSGGKVSSIKNSSSAERYAVNSAVRLLKKEMNSKNNMSIVQSWQGEYTQADFDASGNSGKPQLTSGAWVMDKETEDWSTQINAEDNGYYDVSRLLENSSVVQADLYQIRDIMAYEVYLHYWNVLSAHDGGTDDNPDPWSTAAIAEQDWQDVLSNASDQAYKIKGTAPYVLSLKGDKNMPKVYALFSMDSLYQMEIELYCRDADGNKTEDRYLIFTPDTASVKRSSEETLKSSTTNDSFGLSDGSIISNTTYTYSFSRSVALTLKWDTGKISMSSGGTE